VRNDRGARVARGSAIAVFATLVASLAHTLGGGAPPGLLAIALALAFSVPFAVATVGRHGGLARAGVAALGAQLALHALYSLGTAGPAVLTDASGRVHSSHTHVHAGGVGLPADETAAVFPVPSAEVAASAGAHGAHPGVWMIVAHAAAALLTIVFIAGADRVLAAVAASARGIRIALVLTRAPSGAPRPAGASAPVVVRAIGAARDLHLLAAPRRGPPIAVAAA
jgi:hypothetical protein